MSNRTLINILHVEDEECAIYSNVVDTADHSFFFQKANNEHDFLQTLQAIDNQIAIIDISSSIEEKYLNALLEEHSNRIAFIFIIKESQEERVQPFLANGLFDYLIRTNADRLLIALKNASLEFGLLKDEFNTVNDIVSNIEGCAFQFVRSINQVDRVIYASDGLSRITDISYRELKSSFSKIVSRIPEEHRESFIRSINESAKSLTVWSYKFPLMDKQGNLKWLRGSSTPKLLANNDIIWSGVILDITREIVVDQYSNISQNIDDQFKAIFNATVEAILTIDQHGIIHSCNSATSELFGYTKEELVGNNVSMLMPQNEAINHDKYIHNYMSSGVAKVLGKGRNIKCLKRNGEIFPAYLGLSKYMVDSKQMFVGLIQDMTEISETVDALMNSEIQLYQQKSILELTHKSLADYVYSKDFDKTTKELLTGLLTFTRSQFGFIGEIVTDEEGNSRLQINSASYSVKNPINAIEQYPEIKDYENIVDGQCPLLKATYENAEVISIQEPEEIHKIFRTSFNVGRFENYLGVPVYYGNQIIGMYGLFNEFEHHDANLVNLLKPVNTSYGVVIQSNRLSSFQEKIKQELLIARDEANSANQAKSQFLTKMSHELRTPLNAILGYTQLLEMSPEAFCESDYENIVGISTAGKLLLQLINEILDLSSLEEGKITPKAQHVDVVEIVSECIDAARALSNENGVSVNYQGLDSYEYLSDYSRLKQILTNLITNAITYNKNNGTVNVSIETSDKQLCIHVTDSGIGISREVENRLFSSFEHLVDSNTPAEGIGIGLYISQKLAHLLGGDITYKSDYGKGSTFTLSLPLANSTPLSEEKTNQQMKKVLYIEDNDKNMNMMKQIFDLFENIKFYGAKTPEKGLDFAITEKPDLILLDINLPSMNGYELLEILRSTSGLENTNYIGISALAMPDDINRAQEANLVDYFVKPLNIQSFIQKIGQVLQLV